MRKMKTATQELNFTDLVNDTLPGMNESRARAKSVGATSKPDLGVLTSTDTKLGKSSSALASVTSRGAPLHASPLDATSHETGTVSSRGSFDSRALSDVVKTQDVPERTIGPTMRQLVKMVQRLLSDYQVAFAARLLDQLAKEVVLTQILDTPIPGAWKLSSSLLQFADSERNVCMGFMQSFDVWAAELVGSDFDQGEYGNTVEFGSNLLDKLEKRDVRHGKNHRSKPKKAGNADKDTMKGGTLSSALGLDSDTLGNASVMQGGSHPSVSSENQQATIKRRSEAAQRASLLPGALDGGIRRRGSCKASLSHGEAPAEVLHKELTGSAPRMSLTHALGLQHASHLNPPAAKMQPVASDQSAERNDEHPVVHHSVMSGRSSINSEASMIEDEEASELPSLPRSSILSHTSGLRAMTGEGSHSGLDMKPGISEESSWDSKDNRSSLTSGSTAHLAQVIGRVEKLEDHGSKPCELELEVDDPLPSKDANSPKDEVMDSVESMSKSSATYSDKANTKEIPTGMSTFYQLDETKSEPADPSWQRSSVDEPPRWNIKRSSSVTFPLRSSISLPPARFDAPEIPRESVQSSLPQANSLEFSDRPSEIKVTEPAESGFKETRFKIRVPTKDEADDEDSEGGASQGSDKKVLEEIIVKPTGSILGSCVAIQSKADGLKKVKSTKSMGQLHHMFKENLEEDRAAYLSSPSHMFIVHPNSMFRMIWDVASLTIILFEAIILPLGLCFDMYPPDVVMWISTAFFAPDVCLNMITGFYHNGLLILRQKIIVKRYLMGWFMVDFLSTVPWEVFFNQQRGQAGIILKFAKISKLMRVLRLLRVLKLKALIQRVEDMCSSYIVLVTLSITKIVAFYMLVCHWTACMWGWLGSYDGKAPPHNKDTCEPDGPCEHGIGIRDSPWRRRYGLIGEPAVQHYLTALQFSTGLLTGAELNLMPGYWLERVFITMMMIVSFLVCSMIISQIVVVMDKINQDNSEYLEHSRIIRDFMVSRGMPIKLQTKVKRYLEYQFKSRKVVHQNHEILMKLSPFLRIEIQEHMNKAILENHPFFKNMESSVLSQVCCLAQSVLYAPGDVVMRKGQIESLICFIVRGQLQIVEARKGVSIYIRAPSWTGDRGLFVTTIRVHTVTCSMHSELLTIRQENLIDLVSQFPTAEAYIKDYCKKVIRNDPSTIFCHFCRMTCHDMDTCKELTEALKRQSHQAVETSSEDTKAWFHRAKQSVSSSTSRSTQRKTRDSRVLNAPSEHITVEGFSRRTTNAAPSCYKPNNSPSRTQTAAAYSAWDEK